jgi:hypothetical protein
MSIILDCFGTMVLFVTPTAVELSDLDRAAWLQPPNVYEGLLAGNHFAGSKKERSKLSLSS